jgi:hypothetical protein
MSLRGLFCRCHPIAEIGADLLKFLRGTLSLTTGCDWCDTKSWLQLSYAPRSPQCKGDCHSASIVWTILTRPTFRSFSQTDDSLSHTAAPSALRSADEPTPDGA